MAESHTREHPESTSSSSPAFNSSHSNNATSEPTSSSDQAWCSSLAQQQHYAENDILLRIEYLSDSVVKRFTLAIWVATAVGFALLLTALVLVTTKPQSFWFHTQSLFIVNATIATIKIIALSVMCVYFLSKVRRALHTGKRWSTRRTRGVRVSAVELTLQLINSVIFLVPNAYSLANECTWFSPVVVWTAFGSWTIWNTFFLLCLIQGASLMPLPPKLHKKASPSQSHEGVIYLDAPILLHWRKAGLWVCMEVCLLGLSIELVTHSPSSSVILDTSTTTSCHDLQYSCDFTTAGHVFANFVTASAVLYLLWYFTFIYRAFRTYYSQPYGHFRMENMILRLQLRQRALVFTFFILNIIVYFYVKRATCASYVLAWYGMAPMQVVMTSVALARAFLATPMRTDKTAILQVWLQEFAWTEEDVPRKRAERVSLLPKESLEGFRLNSEPLFCFETGVKCMYWSFLAYASGELPESESPFKSKVALFLFNLKNFDIVWEESTNAKAVIGWSDDPTAAAAPTVVIAFRGTAAASNVIADLQVNFFL